MRMLSPEPGGVDLAERYAYPPDRVWMRANMVASLDGAAQRDAGSGGLGGPAVRPLAVVSRMRDLVVAAALFTEARARTIVLAATTAEPARLDAARERADVIVAGKDSLDFAAAVRELEARGHRRLLCEGGPG